MCPLVAAPIALMPGGFFGRRRPLGTAGLLLDPESPRRHAIHAACSQATGVWFENRPQRTEFRSKTRHYSLEGLITHLGKPAVPFPTATWPDWLPWRHSNSEHPSGHGRRRMTICSPGNCRGNSGRPARRNLIPHHGDRVTTLITQVPLSINSADIDRCVPVPQGS